MIKVRADIIKTAGTKMPAILSANFAMGALDSFAWSTNFIIWEIVVSSPTFSAMNLKEPVVLIDAEITLSPTDFETGIDSPVTADSSREDVPSIIFPSTATASPGLTIMTSPTFTSSIFFWTSSLFSRTVAIFGARSINFDREDLVLFLDFSSRYLPRVIRVKIMAEDSKYKFFLYTSTKSKSP